MQITDFQNSVVVGSMLGDGSLTKRYGNNNVIFTKVQCLEHEDYLAWHQDVLDGFSKIIKVFSNKIKMENGQIIRLKDKVLQFKIYTKSDKIFTDLEIKWYLRDTCGNYIYNKLGNRIKIIPRDIKLNNIILAIWHCDDGCNVGKNRTISFSTNSFQEDEIDFLISILYKDCNLKSYKCKAALGWVINISSKSYLDFIDMVKPFIKWGCMDKKVSLINYKPPKIAKGELHGMSKLNNNLVKEIFDLYYKGLNQIEIGSKIGVDNTTVQYVLKGKTWRCLGITPIVNRTNNKSGCVGVYLNKSGKWIAEIIVNKKYIRLGSFENKEEAIKIRKSAEVTYRV